MSVFATMWAVGIIACLEVFGASNGTATALGLTGVPLWLLLAAAFIKLGDLRRADQEED